MQTRDVEELDTGLVEANDVDKRRVSIPSELDHRLYFNAKQEPKERGSFLTKYHQGVSGPSASASITKQADVVVGVNGGARGRRESTGQIQVGPPPYNRATMRSFDSAAACLTQALGLPSRLRRRCGYRRTRAYTHVSVVSYYVSSRRVPNASKFMVYTQRRSRGWRQPK